LRLLRISRVHRQERGLEFALDTLRQGGDEDLGADGGLAHLRLLPKAKDSDFKSVELWLKDGAPQRMRFEDPLGGANEVRFSDIRTNAPIDPAQFTFTLPKGAEVIQADGPAGQ